MNLLKEGIEIGAVIPTDLARKITIDGFTKSYQVYKIRLDMLFFNDQNDRIATWISQYKSQHNGHVPNYADKDSYNKIIEDFIIRSNPSNMMTTQNNIELIDQREPGVVLSDGRIIDGNRRFTCLRNLVKKNSRFNYFEAIILDRNIENSAKQIKMLELSIQHGEESKVEYNTIDLLVGIYNDIIDTKLLSIEEYAKSIDKKESEVKKQIEVAELLVEFLEFINAPKQFYIARDLQIAGTLEELPLLLNKCKTLDEREDFKITVFTNMLMKPADDLRQFARKIKAIVTTDYVEEFLEEQKEIAMKVIEKLPAVGEVNNKTIRDVIRTNDDISNELKLSMNKVNEKIKVTKNRNQPIKIIEQATDSLESMDMNILLKLNDSELSGIDKQLIKLEKIIEEIRGHIDV